MLKNNIYEYYPDGIIAHKIAYYANDYIYFERFYDNAGNRHNVDNPGEVYFDPNGKIWGKFYYFHNIWMRKIQWSRLIKNI